MYIYSEKTKKRYDTVAECEEAEKAYDEAIEQKKAEKERLAAARADRAKAVEEAYQKIVDARKEYDALLDAFVKDYGSFHFTVHSGELNPFNLFDWFF